MITLQFSSHNSIGSWAIRFGTWSAFSHVDLVLPDGRLLGARAAGGVAIREQDPAFRTVMRYQVDAHRSVLALAETQIGKPYDWTAILGFIYRRDWQQCDAWFCSELIAWAFSEVGQPLLAGRKFGRITPRDLLLSPHIKEIV